jgi:pentatricopeptide repeat protein
MIQVCARAGNLETAEKLFQTIKDEEFELEQITFLSMIRACSLVDEKKKAKEYFDQMYKLELCPNFIIFEDLYNGLKNL